MYSRTLLPSMLLLTSVSVYFAHRADVNYYIQIREMLQLTHSYTHTRLTALCPGLPGWAGTRKEKPIWILLKQERVSGSGISWAICKSAPRFRQIITPTPHHSVFYRPDALPAAQPTASKHSRQLTLDITFILSHKATDGIFNIFWAIWCKASCWNQKV